MCDEQKKERIREAFKQKQQPDNIASRGQVRSTQPIGSMTYSGLWLFARAFRTDNEKVIVGLPGETGEPENTPLAGTPAQVKKKLLKYVGNKFDEWMAMEPPLMDTEDHGDPLRDPALLEHPDEFAAAKEQNVPTAQCKTEPSPSTSGETGQSDDEVDFLSD